jgi:hypothetical protein
MDCTVTELRRGARCRRIEAEKRPKHYVVLGKRARTVMTRTEARATRDGQTLAQAAESGMYEFGKSLLQRLGLMRAA